MSDHIHRYRVKIQDEALDELDAIYSFICQDSAANAKNFVRLLKNKILKLTEFPHRGTRIKLLEDEDSKGEIRFIEYKGYLIFYTILQKEVIVLHVTGPGQDWMRLFR